MTFMGLKYVCNKCDGARHQVGTERGQAHIEFADNIAYAKSALNAWKLSNPDEEEK